MDLPLVFFPTYGIPTYFGHIFSWNQDFETDKSYPSYRRFLNTLPAKRTTVHLTFEEYGALLSQCMDDINKVQLVKPSDNQYLIKWQLPCFHEFFDTVKGRLRKTPWKRQTDCPYCYVETHATLVTFSCGHTAFALQSMDAQPSTCSIDEPCGDCAVGLCEHIKPLEHTRHLINKECDLNSYNLHCLGSLSLKATYHNMCLSCVEKNIPEIQSLLGSSLIKIENRFGHRYMQCDAHERPVSPRILVDALDKHLPVDCEDYHSRYAY